LKEHVLLLQQADAVNKLNHRKLYLVLDLDETLVYSQRMPPGSIARGTQISVRGSPFDMVKRPGLQTFLQMVSQKFILYLYTMGDEEYTRAAMEVIDPSGKHFTGGICCWRQNESRTHKELERVVCDKRMALIVDDSPDVWSSDLANLCLVRRFVGDSKDDGLQQLYSKLHDIHGRYFAVHDGSSEFDLDQPSPQPPDIRHILREARRNALRGCKIALTGVVAEQTAETLAQQPLSILVRDYGGAVTMGMDEATHLVARQKDGWKHSQKIRRAAQLCQAGREFALVWDHWLLDTICSWERQAEPTYAVPTAELLDVNVPSQLIIPPGIQPAEAAVSFDMKGNGEGDRFGKGNILGLVVPAVMDRTAPPPQKRPREQNSLSDGPSAKMHDASASQNLKSAHLSVSVS